MTPGNVARGGGERAGIRHVAEAAGVSMSTVSNVLNNPDLVAEATRRRVEEAMDHVGYVRNGAARQLRGAPSTVVGCVLLDTANAYFATVARGVEDRLAEAGCVLVQCSTDMRQERQAGYLRLLQEQGVRGVLISPVAADFEEFVRLGRRGTPVVLLDHPRDGATELCAVTVDNVAGGELAARHLLDLGHRDIAFVSAGPPLRTVGDRLAGARRALGGARRVVEIAVRETSVAAIAEAAVARLLDLDPRPTAVICCNDAAALGVYRGLRQRGIAVPDDISVVGYDDVDFAAELSPALTTVRQPAYQLGHAAAALLLGEGEAGHQHTELSFRPELIPRRSTAAPAAGGG
ncbi:LacI family DNA-binding transcriptional regulator [Streptomyces litchfieldiae]|uniref:LacI family DNA-binding transcriptional regulator n=1 Tax=Streptomyces litchfieldiae TaxID=3075543 RepID=A0ABU2MJS2_9ACTN|nr:LacI family DNA-binding transcriptional regulator [Streptomyces sp. DSM 44938]MDT0341839.1 LacI family DNA-binding transcriptional regulator [Streptomyces sp. DSM 44938]